MPKDLVQKYPQCKKIEVASKRIENVLFSDIR